MPTTFCGCVFGFLVEVGGELLIFDVNRYSLDGKSMLQLLKEIEDNYGLFARTIFFKFKTDKVRRHECEQSVNIVKKQKNVLFERQNA